MTGNGAASTVHKIFPLVKLLHGWSSIMYLKKGYLKFKSYIP